MEVWQQTAYTARTYTAHCTRIVFERKLYVCLYNQLFALFHYVFKCLPL